MQALLILLVATAYILLVIPASVCMARYLSEKETQNISKPNH